MRVLAVLFVGVSAVPAAAQDSPAKGDGKSGATQSVFEKMARDPYLERYGRPPGEGWIPLLDTRTELRIGGFIQMNYIHDLENAGYPYGWFVPATIPVPTDDHPNTEFDARTSRITFESRTNTEEYGSVSTMIDLDFFGNFADLSGPFATPRLRQAYVTWVGKKSNVAFTAGQTWSTFLDLGVWPEIADLQGPNAMTGQRQGLLRGSVAFGEAKDLIFDLGIEQPGSAVQNGTGLKSLPDIAARLNWQRGWGHLQVAGLGRRILAENSATAAGRDAAFGYGLSLSGALKVPGTRRDKALTDDLGVRQDLIQFQVQGGSGIGRYVFDPSTAPEPYDAIYDDTSGKTETLDEMGFFVGYHRWWSARVRSQLVYGWLSMDNLSIQGDGVIHETTYALANLAYRAFPRMDIALEYTYGERVNKSAASGHANRIMFAVNYGF